MGDVKSASAAIPEFDMPAIDVGDVVLWSYNEGTEKCPGIVMKVGARAISINVMTDNLHNLLLKSGVRHANDPWLKKFPQHDGGCWSYTMMHRRVLDLVRNFEDVEE